MLFLILIIFFPVVTFALGMNELLDPNFWAPYAAILLAISEFLAMTSIVKANGILSFIIDMVIKGLKGLKK